MKILCFIIAIFYLAPVAVSAISFDTDLTTMAWMRQEPITKNGVDSSVPIYEYLRTSMTNENDSLSAYIHARVKKDVKNSKKTDWRIFSGYLKWSVPGDSYVMIGRQFLPYNPGFLAMDGVKANLRGFKGFSSSIYAGSSVSSWSVNDKRSGVAGTEINFPEIK